MWDTAVDNKLHSIKPILSEWRPAYKLDRKEEVVLTRLRIGHSYANHSYLLKGEEQPMCIPCDAPFTIKHVSFIFAEGRGTAHVHPLRCSLHH